jgi:TetR/AcrR family hemagglutinin/protease transcriptional regulator
MPPQPRSSAAPRRRLAPDARRAQLLEAALRVFARRGLGAARHAEIAAECGVSVATVFAYFQTRPTLVAAVLGEVRREYVDQARRLHASRLPAPELLLQHALDFTESVGSRPDHARLWLEWSSALREDTWPSYVAFESEVVGVIAATLRCGQREGTIARDVAPEDGARIAIGAAHMIARMRLGGWDAPEVDRFAGSVVRVLVGGLAPRVPEGYEPARS